MSLLLGVLVAGLQAAYGQSRHRQSIEFSDPKDGSVVTNITASDPSRNNLRDLEEELVRPLRRSMSSEAPFDPSLGQPYIHSGVMMMPSKKARALAEKRKNWAFSSPEEMFPGLTAEDMFHLPQLNEDGVDPDSVSSIERFHKQLENEGTRQKTGPGQKRNPNDRYAGQDRKSGLAEDDTLDPVTRGLNERRALWDPAPNDAVKTGALDITPDSAPLADLFKTRDNDDDSMDRYARQHKAQLDQQKNFISAMGWDMATPASAPDLSKSSLTGSLPSSPLGSPTFLSGGSAGLPAASPFAGAGIPGSSQPSLPSPILPPVASRSVPMMEPSFLPPKRASSF